MKCQTLICDICTKPVVSRNTKFKENEQKFVGKAFFSIITDYNIKTYYLDNFMQVMILDNHIFVAN